MSYTVEVRKMLCEAEVKKNCCAVTELNAFLYFAQNAKTGSAGQRSFVTKEKYIAGRVAFLHKKVFGSRTEIYESRSKKGKGTVYYEISLNDMSENVKAEELFKRPLSLEENECCKKAVLRAAFVMGGAVSSPDSSATYVELYFAEEADALAVKDVLSGFGIKSGCSVRRDKHVVYIKNFEGICDFLILTGAQKAMLDFQMSKTDREVNNSVNRTMNCDMANIDRVSANGMKEKAAIEYLMSSGRFESLSEPLKAVAKLRLEYPLATLSELGQMMKPVMSKSGVSHRMKKILEIGGVKNP